MSSLTAGLAASPAVEPVKAGGTPDLIVLIGIAVLLGITAWVTYHRINQRRRALARFASRHGFTFSHRPEADQTGVPLLDQARNRRWERRIDGTWGGTPFMYADFQCELGDGREAQVTRYSIVRMPLEWSVPTVHVPSPEVASELRHPVPCNIEVVMCGSSVAVYGRPQCRPELLECLIGEAVSIRRRAPDLLREHRQGDAGLGSAAV